MRGSPVAEGGLRTITYGCGDAHTRKVTSMGWWDLFWHGPLPLDGPVELYGARSGTSRTRRVLIQASGHSRRRWALGVWLGVRGLEA
jgi:hypothetical protein